MNGTVPDISFSERGQAKGMEEEEVVDVLGSDVYVGFGVRLTATRS